MHWLASVQRLRQLQPLMQVAGLRGPGIDPSLCMLIREAGNGGLAIVDSHWGRPGAGLAITSLKPS